MLSDHEQRALEELERCYVMEASEPGYPRRTSSRSDHPPGFRVLVASAGISVALLLTGVPAAAASVVLATAIGGWYWRIWSSVRAGEGIRWWGVPGVGDAPPRGGRRVGESIRRYLAWLAEAE